MLRYGFLLGAVALSVPAMAQQVTAPAGPQEMTPPVAPENVTTQSADRVWTTVYNSDLRYYTFSGNRGFPAPVNGVAGNFGRGGGSQFYMPMAFNIVGNPTEEFKIESTARAGIVSSQQNTRGLSGSYTGGTDTVWSGTVTYLAVPGFQPFFSLNTNLPTGTSVLFGRAANARLDADLVDLSTFGQGFNIGPSIGTNIPVNENLTFSVGAGYTSLGEYPREGAINPETGTQGTITISPGDSASFNASVGYQDGPFSAFLSPVYTISTTTKIGNVGTFRSGDSIGLSGNVSYKFTPELSSILSGVYTHTSSNFIANAGFAGLHLEAPNSNSDLYRIGLDTTYKLTDDFSLGPLFSVMDRDRNAFIPQTVTFVPAKVRWGAGAALNYSVSNAISLTARVEHIWTNENAHPDQIFFGTLIPGTGTVALSQSGWGVAGGLSIKF